MSNAYELFRPTYTDRKTGQRAESGSYYVRFTDHLGTRRRWLAFPDERGSRALAERLVALASCRRNGESPDPKLQRWLDEAPDELREKLSAADLIDPLHSARGELLAVHLEGKADESGNVVLPGWKQHLLAGRSDRTEYAALMVGRVKRVLDGCGFAQWRDLAAPGAVTKIETFLGGLRDRKEISGQTFSYYVREVKSFARWMVGEGRASTFPLSMLKGVGNAEVDKRETRTLGDDELRRVLAVTAKAGAWKQWDGADRAILYRFAYESGVRPGQIRKLTVGSFDFDANPPTVTAKAATVKRRKVHVQALRPDTAAELKALFANRVPEASAFNMPDKFLLARMFRSDLAAARAAWIAEAGDDAEEKVKRHRSDFLADVDHDGRRAIFYSLRHSHGTALGAAGHAQATIQASLHHTKSATTDRYVRLGLDAKARAVNSLPNVRPPTDAQAVLLATGTDDATPEAVCLSVACPTLHPRAGACGNTNAPGVAPGALSGERDGTRTRNHRIDSPDKLGKNPVKSGGPASCLSIACSTATPDPDSAALLALLPRLTAKQRRQLRTLAESMVE